MAVSVKERDVRLRNVLSLRKKMTSEDISMEMLKLSEFLKENKIKKAGSITTVTFSIEVFDGVPLMDMEILVPLYARINISGEYVFKPIFHMVNAVCVTKESDLETNRIHNLLCWHIYDRLISKKLQ
jgi:hypothetical protein